MSQNIEASQLLEKAFKGESFLLFDGAFGTMLQRAGLAEPGKNPDEKCLTHPGAITAIHQAYVEAGVQVVTAATFNESPRAYKAVIAQTKGNDEEAKATKEELSRIITQAVQCARKSGAQVVAGDIGPSGVLMKPLGQLDPEEAFALYALQAKIAAEAGVDLLILETFTDLQELKLAVLAAKSVCDIPLVASMSFGENNRTFLGTSPEIAAITISELGVSALGLNCSLGPKEMLPAVQAFARYSSVPVLVQPNAGLPKVTESGETVYEISVDDYLAAYRDLLDAGASLVGGCCGTSPEYMKALVDELKVRSAPASVNKSNSVAYCSSQVFVEADSIEDLEILPLVSADELDDLLLAIEDDEFEDFLLDLSFDKQAEGAEMLSLDFAFEGVNQRECLLAAVSYLQSANPIPLAFVKRAETDEDALHAALRIYAGKALVLDIA